MENYEKELIGLIKITDKNLGYRPQTPSEFNQLIVAIKKKVGHSISLSSAKRLWGYVNYSNVPSVNILNILSRFNDFDDWEDFLRRYGTLGLDENSHFLNDNMIESDNLKEGDVLLISWEKDKSCSLLYLGDHRYRVLEAQNIKLLPDDEFMMHSVAVDLPFYAADIRRGDEVITGYVGARKSGIKSISLKEADK
ncbi:hypothetical protein [Lepagella muris]|jgi:hypothetical protein|uniref:Uncharacterized protein n=1 Tax=Lepagella muris TaxID=3032870 RepID=A0AC61RNH1_9BACT|nr:hypothetical protein [Lepagella muris]TGY80835.1 hypothetical protein E5331_00210 [Lepagella muris]THG53913.1 hypothetical protein E5984_00210 [Bacteroidales bacterium]TKC59711.1 hypothetical protein E5359_008455 [Bacteroidales bacterium]